MAARHELLLPQQVIGSNKLNNAAAALCAYCLPLHGGHRVVQVRRSSYHDVVRVSEVCRLIDVSCVQTYVINGAKIVFLNERPPGKAAAAAVRCCEVCGRGLLDSFRFCSLGCKLGGMKRDPELTFVLHGKLGLESTTASDESSAPSKGRRTSAVSGRARDGRSKAKMAEDDAAGIRPGTPPPICSGHRASRRRKGSPRRAPPY
ncbi:hypothetical protein E2562_001726 [Oryza meyeriana var. granulata]|uniref:Uncharacterized protein n=1 Tax=Oryza meyeriana var. granulata TaxID=110450 RepID=A0A6G1CBN1_9ORYZ|nr:hypothetical protein E2562_001726 [Oryza meyeriana var. granulata]